MTTTTPARASNLLALLLLCGRAVAPPPPQRRVLSGTCAPCANPPCAAPLTGKLGSTVRSGTDARTSTHFPTGTDIYGPLEESFGAGEASVLSGLGCSDPSSAALAAGYGGLDTQMAEATIAHACGVTLPRIDGAAYVSLLDECGHDGGGFKEGMACLYDATADGHSPQVGAACDSKGIYGKWEDYSTTQALYALPALDACNGHFGVTPDSNGATVYHYHVSDLPPFTVGCFGPAVDTGGAERLVSPTACEALYGGSDGCGGADVDPIAVGSGVAPVAYDRWCPCFDADGQNTEQPPSPPPSPLATPNAASLTISLAGGYTQMSLNLVPTSLAIADVFAAGNLALTAGGRLEGTIKDSLQFTEYYPDFTTWFGGLTHMTTSTMYIVQLTHPLDLTIVGPPVDLTTQTQTLEQGWNYLPCPHPASVQVPDGCAGAACNLPLATYAAGDQVKSKTAFTDYYAGYGFFAAQPFYLEPGQGYMLQRGPRRHRGPLFHS